MTTIHLEGVALRQHERPYPFDLKPYAHQSALRDLIRSEERFIAVNDSPTGGGKTSSWLAPALEEALHTVAVYPTNALVADQVQSIQERTEAVDHDVAVLELTADRLAEERTSRSTRSNGDVIERWFRESRQTGAQVIALTNPDIFVMMCRDLYRSPSREYRRFELAVVDEFHRAGRKERNTLRYLIDELLEEDEVFSHLSKAAFLSATPDAEAEHLFERAVSAPYHRLTEDGEDEQRGFQDVTEAGWRGVMPPVDLDVREAPTFGTAEVLLQNFEETVTFCEQGRTVIILDGVQEVDSVYRQLDDALEGEVYRIDGFHPENKAEKLRAFDTLVSNSAVEVGIDFDVDRLIFAGHSRSSFLQRLGRLRNEDTRRVARCYVPPEIAAGLQEQDGAHLSRTAFRQCLGQLYPEPREPESFDWRYSAPEAIRHLRTRLMNAPSDRQDSLKTAGRERIRRHFLEPHDVRFSHHDLKRTKDAIDWEVLEKLQWYRGDSLEALVFHEPEQRLVSYDLFHLLRHGDVTFHEEATFKRIVQSSLDPDRRETLAREARYADGFCTYHGPIDSTEEGYGRSVYFTGQQIAGWLTGKAELSRNRKPRVLDGIQIQAVPSEDHQPRVRTLDALNERLRNRADRLPGEAGGLLCYPVQGHSSQVSEVFDLGSFFFLYPVEIGHERSYSLAIGTDALYLDCLVRERNEQYEDEQDELIGL